MTPLVKKYKEVVRLDNVLDELDIPEADHNRIENAIIDCLDDYWFSMTKEEKAYCRETE